MRIGVLYQNNAGYGSSYDIFDLNVNSQCYCLADYLRSCVFRNEFWDMPKLSKVEDAWDIVNKYGIGKQIEDKVIFTGDACVGGGSVPDYNHVVLVELVSCTEQDTYKSIIDKAETYIRSRYTGPYTPEPADV